MNWPDDPLKAVRASVGALNRFRAQAAESVRFADMRFAFDETCPKGIVWLRGATIVRVDPRTHDAHVGAVGGE